jgi:hypothetical protein
VAEVVVFVLEGRAVGEPNFDGEDHADWFAGRLDP